MFCKNCGKSLEDEARICDGCGTPTDVTNPSSNESAGVPVQKANNSVFSNTLKILKGFFSKDTVKTVGESAKSQGMEWLILGLLSAVVYSIALTVNITTLAGPLGSIMEGPILGICFVLGLLFSIVPYFLMSLCIFGAMKLIFKKAVTMKSVLNLVATASLSLTTAYLLNIIFGFLSTTFIAVFFLAGLIGTAVLLYIGIQRFEKLEKSPFIAYVGVWAVFAIILLFVLSAVIRIVFSNILGGLMESDLSGIDMSGLFG